MSKRKARTVPSQDSDASEDDNNEYSNLICFYYPVFKQILHNVRLMEALMKKQMTKRKNKQKRQKQIQEKQTSAFDKVIIAQTCSFCVCVYMPNMRTIFLL